MSYFGTVLLARAEVPLPRLPEVAAAFGSHWRVLQDHGGGWQLLDLGPPWPHQWPTVGAGPQPLADRTDAPVLAAWISDTACAQIAAAVPGGTSWQAHLVEPDQDDECGYDHELLNPLRQPPGTDRAPTPAARLVDDLVAWAAAAGLTTTPARVEAALARDAPMDDRYYGVVAALGLPGGRRIEPRFGHMDSAWWEAWDRGNEAGTRVCRQWTSLLNRYRGWDPDAVAADPYRVRLEPGDEDFTAFVDMVAAGMYDDLPSEQQLIEHGAQLLQRWPTSH